MLGWKKHKLESRLLGEISVTSDMQMTPPLWQKEKRNQRASWWKWKRGEKVGFKLNIQKTKIMASGPITSWQIDGETMETVRGFIFLGSKGASFTSVKGVGHDGSKLAHIHIHVSILPDSPPMHTLILLFFFFWECNSVLHIIHYSLWMPRRICNTHQSKFLPLLYTNTWGRRELWTSV